MCAVQPENVMLEDRTACRVKIIDFGLARRLIPGQQLCVVQGTPDFVGELSSLRYVMRCYLLLCYVMLFDAMLCYALFIHSALRVCRLPNVHKT